MTYRELFEMLRNINPERLDDTVTVLEPHENEYIPVICAFESSENNDVLDPGHLFLVLKA